MQEYSAGTLKLDNDYLTGVKKVLVGCYLTLKLFKIWIYPMKVCEADPCRDFFGVETINCGPALWNVPS